MRLIAALSLLTALSIVSAAPLPILPANFQPAGSSLPQDCDGCSPAGGTGKTPSQVAARLGLSPSQVAGRAATVGVALGVTGATAVGLTAFRNKGLNQGFVDDFKRGDVRTIFSLKKKQKPHTVVHGEQGSRADAPAERRETQAEVNVRMETEAEDNVRMEAARLRGDLGPYNLPVD